MQNDECLEKIKIAYKNNDYNSMKEIFSFNQFDFAYDKLRKEVLQSFVESNMLEIKNKMNAFIENHQHKELREILKQSRNYLSISVIFDLSQKIEKKLEEQLEMNDFNQFVKTGIDFHIPIELSAYKDKLEKLEHPQMKFIR